jgi:hypothetical protein
MTIEHTLFLVSGFSLMMTQKGPKHVHDDDDDDDK